MLGTGCTAVALVCDENGWRLLRLDGEGSGRHEASGAKSGDVLSWRQSAARRAGWQFASVVCAENFYLKQYPGRLTLM
jgi:hypothetical protein